MEGKPSCTMCAASSADDHAHVTGGAAAGVRALAALDGVAEAVDAARAAATELRWHNALRRRTPECRAEAIVRAARASAALEGARFPIPYVREVLQGRPAPDDLSGTQLTAAIRTAALAGELSTRPHPLRGKLTQVLAQLSLAAGAGLAPEERIGRPRLPGETPGDLSGLPPAPGAGEIGPRLATLAVLLDDDTLPGIVTAAILHGEILALRPFGIGNGLIARALFRIHIVSSGVDPTGVAVPEAAFLADAVGYGQGAAGFTTGRDVPGWIEACARALVDGAGEGRTVCQAVQSGKLPTT